MIKRIKFTPLPVRDQDRALDFYTRKLGFRVFTDQPYKEGQRWIELQIPGAETRLVLTVGPVPQDAQTPGVVLVADDVEKTYAELKEKGVEFVQDVTRAPWGTHALFRDSEGNLVLLGSA